MIRAAARLAVEREVPTPARVLRAAAASPALRGAPRRISLVVADPAAPWVWTLASSLRRGAFATRSAFDPFLKSSRRPLLASSSRYHVPRRAHFPTDAVAAPTVRVARDVLRSVGPLRSTLSFAARRRRRARIVIVLSRQQVSDRSASPRRGRQLLVATIRLAARRRRPSLPATYRVLPVPWVSARLRQPVDRFAP